MPTVDHVSLTLAPVSGGELYTASVDTTLSFESAEIAAGYKYKLSVGLFGDDEGEPDTVMLRVVNGKPTAILHAFQFSLGGPFLADFTVVTAAPGPVTPEVPPQTVAVGRLDEDPGLTFGQRILEPGPGGFGDWKSSIKWFPAPSDEIYAVVTLTPFPPAPTGATGRSTPSVRLHL